MNKDGYGVLMSREDHDKIHEEMIKIADEIVNDNNRLEYSNYNSETLRDAVFFDILVSEGMYNVPETISDNDLDRSKQTMRISLSHLTTVLEINNFLEIFIKEYNNLII